MCILFFHVKRVTSRGKFRIVIISNRDEILNRPTLSAHFWNDNPDIYGGRDQEENGTWLAINKRNARISTLLNISSRKGRNPSAVSRGHFVPDFLTTNLNVFDFMKNVTIEAKKHNPFHLLCMQVLKNDVKIQYTGLSDDGVVIEPEELLEHEIFKAISNSPMQTPFRKCTEGLDIFKQIISKFDDVNKKETLINELVKFAQNENKFYPDPELTNGKPESPFVDRYSSIFVSIPEIGYGTRTHTVILVDDTGHVDITEVTKISATEWKKTSESFNFEL